MTDTPTPPARRRRRRRGRSTPKGDGLEARAARALAELAAVARAVAAQSGAPPPSTIDLRLELRELGPAGFLEAARLAAEASRPDEGIWRAGALYCFQCRANNCHHASPPEPTDVFAGYAPTGKPVWQNFIEACVARRVPGVDRVFEGRMAAFVETDSLTAELLPSFGRGSAIYRVLGQVVIGLIPADLRDREGQRVPLAMQIVETRRPGQPVQLRLNLVGLQSEAVIAAAADGAPHGPAERLRQVLQAARRRLGAVSRRAVTAEARRETYDVDQAVRSMLGALRGDLLRVLDPSARRTHHAETRRRGGQRPTSSVWRDARGAGPERLFVDAHRDTVVVAGPKGRAHVFSRDGKHVTSLRLAPGELERRVGRKRWQVADPEVVRTFRDGLAAHEEAPS